MVPFLIACEEEFGAMEDRQAPTIEIIMPTEFEAFAGDTLKIKVRISDNDQLHDWYIGLNNLSTMSKEIHWSEHTHAQSIELDTMYILNRDLPYSHFQLQLQAEDHAGNSEEKRIAIFIKERF